MSDKKAPEMMDPSAPERPVGEAASTRQRACYAAKTLIAEVLDLFPETKYQIVDYNGRNVGLSVVFDTVYGQELTDLILLTGVDPRVGRAEANDGGSVKVEFRNQPRLYDLRDSFGLDEAWMVLGDVDDSIEPDWEVGEST